MQRSKDRFVKQEQPGSVVLQSILLRTIMD